MLKVVVTFFATFLLFSMSAQDKKDTSGAYLEDQFYLNLTYNILNNRPDSISPKGLSNGISFGYIKDLPLNEQRNFGLAIGLGYGRNTFYQNLKISEVNGVTTFDILKENETFDRNKFSMHTIEMPFEIRFRTSTETLYKFWRLYPGIKFSYIFSTNAKLKQNGIIKTNNIQEINKFQYGLTLSAGYGTWNINLYYGLKDIFSDAFVSSNNQSINMNDIRIGLIFYIL